MEVGTLEEFIDEDHGIISTNLGPNYYVPICSFVDKDLLDPGQSVFIRHDCKPAPLNFSPSL